MEHAIRIKQRIACSVKYLRLESAQPFILEDVGFAYCDEIRRHVCG